MDITSFSPRTGRMVKEDGSITNIADVISKGSQPVTSQKVPIHAMSPMTGRMVREDGSIVNIAELIEQFINTGGGSFTPEQIQEAVNNYLTQNPVQITQATETILGGIKAKEKTDETVEAAIDPATGKLYVPTYPSSGASGYVSPDTVEHGTADTTLELTPNVLHKWDEVTSLDLTLGSETDGVVNEFMFSFISGATATQVTLPSTVKGLPAIGPNSKYEMSIVDNCLAYGRWDTDVSA